MIFTWVAALNCNFFKITYYDTSANRSVYHSIGLWTIESKLDTGDFFSLDYSYCVPWNEDYYYQPLSLDELDGAMKAARVFGMMTFILSQVAFILIMIPACVSFGNHNEFVKIVSAILVFLGVFTILDLVSECIRINVHFFHFSLLKANALTFTQGCVGFRYLQKRGQLCTPVGRYCGDCGLGVVVRVCSPHVCSHKEATPNAR
jgi:hypothetical protein